MAATFPHRPTDWLPHLLQFWMIAALITFGVMLTHRSDAPIFLGRYSALVTAVLAGLLVFIGTMWGFRLWLRQQPARQTKIDHQLEIWRKRTWLTPVILSIACIALMLVWIFFLGNHLPAYSFLRVFIVLTIMISVLALIGDSAASPARVKSHYLAWFGIGLIAVIGLLTLSFYPNLAKTDEAFVFSMARNAAETGYYSPTIYPHSYPDYYYGGIWIQMMAAWLKATGISFESGRLYNLVLASWSLLFIWVATSRLYNKATAWYAVLIGAYAFIALNHIRFDIHAAFWLSLGILSFSLNRPGRWGVYWLTGFVVGLSVDSNPVAYCFVAGLLLYHSWDYFQAIRLQRKWVWPPFWWTLLGSACAFAFYVINHSVGSFAGGETSAGMLSAYVEVVKNNLTENQYLSQIQQYLNAFLTTQPLLFGLMLLGIMVGLREPTRTDRFILILYFTWMAVIVFAYFYFPIFYLLLGLPIFIILAAHGLSRGINFLLGLTDNNHSATAITTIFLLVWLTASLIRDIQELPSQSIEDVVEVGRIIAQTMPEDAVIVAAESYYFGMLEHRNFVGGAVESIMTNLSGLSPDQVWPLIAPDAIVFSEGWSTEPEHSSNLMSYMNETNFIMLTCYQTKSFGRIELWTKTIPAGVTPSETCIQVCNPRTGC